MAKIFKNEIISKNNIKVVRPGWYAFKIYYKILGKK